ncbi:MAG: hypothetical protein ACR2OV_00065 [Hyphomicrobiaceae bacterium]
MTTLNKLIALVLPGEGPEFGGEVEWVAACAFPKGQLADLVLLGMTPCAQWRAPFV